MWGPSLERIDKENLSECDMSAKLIAPAIERAGGGRLILARWGSRPVALGRLRSDQGARARRSAERIGRRAKRLSA